MMCVAALFTGTSLWATGEQGEGFLESFPVVSDALDAINDDVSGIEMSNGANVKEMEEEHMSHSVNKMESKDKVDDSKGMKFKFW